MEQPKGVEAKLKILGGGMRKSKGLFRINNTIDVCTMISVGNIGKYKVAKKTTKLAINVAKRRTYDDLYQCLSTMEGEKNTYIYI